MVEWAARQQCSKYGGNARDGIKEKRRRTGKPVNSRDRCRLLFVSKGTLLMSEQKQDMPTPPRVHLLIVLAR